MPVKMVICAICGETVTRRSTHSLKKLGKGEGRACKSHYPVQELASLLQEKEILEKKLQRVERKKKQSEQWSSDAALKVRALHLAHNVPYEEIYNLLRENGMSEQSIEEIRIEVNLQIDIISDDQLKKIIDLRRAEQKAKA